MEHLSIVARSCLYTMRIAADSDPRQIVAEGYTVRDVGTRLLRARLILEEALETIDALGFDVTIAAGGTARPVAMETIQFLPARTPDLWAAVDGCCDTIYVATGTLCALGAPDLPHLVEVCLANDAKFPGGRAITDSKTGKFLKPPGWSPPDHAAVAARRGQLPAKL